MTTSPGPRNPSYWKNTAARPFLRAPLEDDRTVDVAVVGGGLTGLTTALYLLRSGVSVGIVEAGRVGEGITAGSTAKLTSLHRITYAPLRKTVGEAGARLYAEANEWAIAAIEKLVGELGIDAWLERGPALTYTRDPGEVGLIEGEVAAAAEAGLPVRMVRRADLPFPIEAGIRLDDQAAIHPLRYCHGLADAVEAEGGSIWEATRAVQVTSEDAGLAVRTGAGPSLFADRVVLASGLPFLDRGGFFARAHPSRSYCMVLEGATGIPESMSINTGGPTVSLRPVRPPEGPDLLLVAGFEHKTGQAADTRRHYQSLESFAARHFRTDAVVARWSAQDYMPADGIPLIGWMRPSNHPILVATGFRKWGLTTGTVAARILANLVHGKEDRWAPLFDAGRTQLPAGLGEAMREGLDDAKHFVGDRLRRPEGAPEDLELDSGALCRRDGATVAAYRDETGALHVVSSTCTHMGCRVTWNVGERSWDCPCHGSRFSVGGEVLEGPAVHPLDPA